jgi:hypothetical protein
MKLTAYVMMSIAAAGTVGLGILLWYNANDARALGLCVGIAAAIVFLVYRSSKFFGVRERSLRILAVIVGIFLCLGIATAPRFTDRGSSWNEAVKTMQMLRKIMKANEEYAAVHQGSFAPSLADLHETTSIGRLYTTVYEPMEDQDRVIRHYTLRGVPGKNYWISIYADETGVVRINENGPANRNSRAIF